MIDPITAASSVATVKIFTDVVTHLLKKLADLAIEKKERERLKKNPTQGYRTQSTVKRTRSDKLIEGIAERINPWINKHNFNNSAESYVKSLDDLHGHIRVIGMDGPIPLIHVYTKVNILM